MDKTPSNDSSLLTELRDLARLVHGLAAEVSVGGDALVATNDDGEPATTGTLAERIGALRQQYDALYADVLLRRRQQVVGQLQSLIRKGGLGELQLHLGAGGIEIEGWISVDAPPADLAVNLAQGLPLPSASARHIYASHVLEHLYYPGEVQRFLGDCARVLRPQGVMRVLVPDIEQCIRAYAQGDQQFFDDRRRRWPHWPAGRTMLEDFLAYAGAGYDPGAFFDSHKYGYDFATLSRALQRAGFRNIRRCAYQSSPHPALQIDNHSYVADAAHHGGHYSLFVEASVGA